MNQKMVQIVRNQPSMKGQLSAMPDAVIALVLIAIVAAVGLLVLSNFQTNSSIGNTCIGTNVINSQTQLCGQGGASQTANTNLSAPYNAIGQGISGVSTVTSFLSLIALVVVAAIIIGLVVFAFARGAGGAGERF
jgi:hypothetical protein